MKKLLLLFLVATLSVSSYSQKVIGKLPYDTVKVGGPKTSGNYDAVMKIFNGKLFVDSAYLLNLKMNDIDAGNVYGRMQLNDGSYEFFMNQTDQEPSNFLDQKSIGGNWLWYDDDEEEYVWSQWVITANNLEGSQTYYLPDQTGTLALLSDIPSPPTPIQFFNGLNGSTLVKLGGTLTDPITSIYFYDTTQFIIQDEQYGSYGNMKFYHDGGFNIDMTSNSEFGTNSRIHLSPFSVLNYADFTDSLTLEQLSISQSIAQADTAIATYKIEAQRPQEDEITGYFYTETSQVRNYTTIGFDDDGEGMFAYFSNSDIILGFRQGIYRYGSEDDFFDNYQGININDSGEVRLTSLEGSDNRIVITDASGQLQHLANGTNGQVLKIVSGSPAWANSSNAVVGAGKYTPTRTDDVNIASATMYDLRYYRTDSIVTVSGRVKITPTASGDCSFRITLPIASSGLGANDIAGTGTATNDATGAVSSCAIFDGSNKARLTFTVTSTDDYYIYFIFTYEIILLPV